MSEPDDDSQASTPRRTGTVQQAAGWAQTARAWSVQLADAAGKWRFERDKLKDDDIEAHAFDRRIKEAEWLRGEMIDIAERFEAWGGHEPAPEERVEMRERWRQIEQLPLALLGVR